MQTVKMPEGKRGHIRITKTAEGCFSANGLDAIGSNFLATQPAQHLACAMRAILEAGHVLFLGPGVPSIAELEA